MNTPDVAFEKVDEMVRFASPVQSLERGWCMVFPLLRSALGMIRALACVHLAEMSLETHVVYLLPKGFSIFY